MAGSSKMFTKNLVKILKAVDLMATPKGITIDGLSQALGLGRRSVFRLLAIMETELRFPFVSTRDVFGRKAVYRLPDTYISRLANISLPQMTLTLNEAILLYFLLGHDGVFRGTEIAEDIAGLREKLTFLLPDHVKRKTAAAGIESLFAASARTLKSYKGFEPVIDTLMDAMEQRRSCLVTYNSFQKKAAKTHIIHPLKLVDHKGGLYVFVRFSGHKDIRILAVERITSIEQKDEVFAYPENFDAETLLNSAFDLTFNDPVKAVIRFSANRTPYIRVRRFARKQSIKEHKDGSSTLTITSSGMADVAHWVLSFGADAEVLSPEPLKKYVKAQLKKMTALYK